MEIPRFARNDDQIVADGKIFLPHFLAHFLMIEFLGVVFVPSGNFDDDVSGAIGNGLAAETRLRRDARRFVKLIELRIRCFVAGFEAFLDDYVASGTGTDTAARVIESRLYGF